MSDQWFPPSQLAFYFDSNSWAKGTALYLKNEVLSAQMSPDGDDWRAEAQVLGSLQEPYRVTAHVRVSEGRNLQAWRTQCTCPAGRMCKHAAALGILVAMQGETLRDALLSDNDEGGDTEQQQQVRQERALQQAEFQVRDWLNRLQMADAPTGFVLPGQAHEHFLYCLSAATLGHRPIFHLTIKQAVAKPNGEWAKVKKVVSQALPNDPIWRSCAPGEQGIFDLMKACPPTNSFSSYGFQSAVKLQGAAAEVLGLERHGLAIQRQLASGCSPRPRARRLAIAIEHPAAGRAARPERAAFVCAPGTGRLRSHGHPRAQC